MPGGVPVTSFAAPPPAPPGEPTAREIAAAIRNDQLLWEVARPTGPTPTGPTPALRPRAHFSPRLRDGTPADFLAPEQPHPAGVATVTQTLNAYQIELAKYYRRQRFYLAGDMAPLLSALEDPDRFAAAHVLLYYVTRDTRLGFARNPSPNAFTNASTNGPAANRPFEFESRSDGTFVQVQDGLRAELRPTGETHPYAYYTSGPPAASGGTGATAGTTATGGLIAVQFDVLTCAGRVDPGQLAAIRDQWHRRLDVPVGSVGHGWAVAAALLLPVGTAIAYARRRKRRRARRRLGLCLRCGYDLRGCRDAARCSECGAATAGSYATAAAATGGGDRP
jgi:hypothetical protein